MIAENDDASLNAVRELSLSLVFHIYIVALTILLYCITLLAIFNISYLFFLVFFHKI